MVIHQLHHLIHQQVQGTLQEALEVTVPIHHPTKGSIARVPTHLTLLKKRKMKRNSLAIHDPHARIHQTVQAALSEDQATYLKVQVLV